MAAIFIFHGIQGHPNENWFPWMKKELEKLGHTVFVPAFPNPDAPDLDEWVEHFDRYQSQMNEDAMFIGHSLGATFALRLLEHLVFPIHAAFLVSPVSDMMGNQFDSLTTTFVDEAFNWEKIKRNAKNICIIHSDNDPYIELHNAKELASHLDVDPLIITGGGHFNEASGYTRFDALLEKVVLVAKS